MVGLSDKKMYTHCPIGILLLLGAVADIARAQLLTPSADRVAHFAFDGDIDGSSPAKIQGSLDGRASFAKGLEGKALRVTAALKYGLDNLRLDSTTGFSVQFWVRTTAGSDKRMVLLSQKEPFLKNDLHAQKRPGWVFYLSHGTWAWNIGSGKRRLTYERDNGRVMPLNDGRWHQITMTFDDERSQIRLYFDGINRALYNLGDSDGFDFSNPSPLTVGSSEDRKRGSSGPTIAHGAETLQRLVDAFDALGLSPLRPPELVDLVVSPKRFFERRVGQEATSRGENAAAFLESMKTADLKELLRLESQLMRNPYTVHQSREFMEVAPLFALYALGDDGVTISERAAEVIANRERIHQPEFDIDELAVWNRPLTRAEVSVSYARHFPLAPADLPDSIGTMTAAAWNIEHGGKHFTLADDGWDSRKAIAEMIRREGVDIVMMQETYSSGDFIAGELGYFLAESVDWDYLNQGANLSVLSRFPIEDIYVPSGASFSNVAVKVSLSRTQSMYVMSNWYGMRKFPEVFDFHRDRFLESDTTPTLFAGDFNAVPHVDGGASPASKRLVGAGFVDAFRDLYPDVQKHPGPSHDSGRRIDQVYYIGTGLRNTMTKIVSSWPTEFPSDHYMIVASFDLVAQVQKNKD